jgi:predicted transporter
MQDKSIQSSTRLQHMLLWLVAVLLVIAGVYLSYIRWLGGEWLSRAGCLIVVLGIWSGLGHIIHERFLLGRLKMRRRVTIARLRKKLWAGKAEAEVVEEEIGKIQKRFEEQADALSDALRLSLGILEVSLLIFGTLLWGFGDLVSSAVLL